ncbi:MAG: acyl-homoserine-lactone synthase, partial [Pseudomonadota bacterium]
MTIECVTLDTNHLFPENPIAGQHRLRYDSIIQRQSWPMPTYKNMEYDQYDNPATTYLIWRDEDFIVRGSCRLCQTINGSMLKDHLSFLVDEAESLLEGPDILEGSRFCIDRNT